MIFSTPAIIIPQEKPAIIRASDLRGLPPVKQALDQATFPFPFVAPKSASWRTVVDVTTDGNLNSYYQTCARQLIGASALSPAIVGTAIILSFKATATAGQAFSVDNSGCYFARKAAAGNAWDYNPAFKVQVTFPPGASTGFGLATSAMIDSDPITFPFDPAFDHVVGWDISESSGFGSMGSRAAATTGLTFYYKGVNGDAGTDAPAGYTSALGGDGTRASAGFVKLQVFG